MAAKKTEKNNTAAREKSGGKKYKKTKTTKPAEKQPAPAAKIKTPNGLVAQLIPFAILVAAIFLTVCLLVKDGGVVGGGIKNILLGLFAGAAYTLPLYLLLAFFMWRSDSENGVLPWKVICYLVTFLLTTVLMHFFAGGAETFAVKTHYAAGLARAGGGVVGGVLGQLMFTAFGYALSLVLLFALLFLFVLLMFGVTPRGLWVYIAYKIKMNKERVAASRAAAMAEEEKAVQRRTREREAAQVPLTPAPDAPAARRKRSFDVDVALDESEPDERAVGTIGTDPAPVELPEGVSGEKVFDEGMRRTQERLARTGPADEVTDAADDLPWDESIEPERRAGDVMDGTDIEKMAEEELNLSEIFKEDGGAFTDGFHNAVSAIAAENGADADVDLALSVKREPLAEPPAAETVEETVQEYVFPHIDLLNRDQNPKDENVEEELLENASRLVETLKNFNVRTKIVDVCRGPTITRYELAPEPGTKVRSIANLVDDIALNLATSGVRFEPSIPGKSAVGIEVPNKNAATVHLRTLLENPRFASAKSRLTAALGQDVAGADVFLDVAKMPHLLIAGATGQGKSVCINSLIVSLLFKARPDELKFIMVDPKKVELNIYNGIPHLYMPVISDPKKAAGALSWAVSEMERRYSLIEEVGVRDLKSYNEITKHDPAYEFLPQFVIIIDELADLMMVAKNDVEGPICRIAQKARAAGMHLIIGTQRPSVDVITGLIKANFPSRISFRVSQLVDSRTIIDRAGAESLVGRGDMLYSPVGAHEPMRVQGAFVSDEEVESAVEFIKTNNGGAEYNPGAIAEVERNAASIGSGKKDGGPASEDEDGEETDPMLRPAIELAVESGKISTSLIQRRLSLGYGRAAKLIDRMEQLGYVSAPDGQKPRDVLITREEFMEMVLKDTDS